MDKYDDAPKPKPIITFERNPRDPGHIMRVKFDGSWRTFKIATNEHDMMLHACQSEAMLSIAREIRDNLMSITGQTKQEAEDFLLETEMLRALLKETSRYFEPITIKQSVAAVLDEDVEDAAAAELPQARIIGSALQEFFENLFGVTPERTSK